MAYAMVQHMRKQGVKTARLPSYTDAYGELWLKGFTEEAAKAGIKLVATERFARNDTSVTAQALKIASARPDAVLIVASGSGAGMPQKGHQRAATRGKIYQTHAAATRDLMRTAGKDAEGTYVASGPGPLAEQLPDSHPSKPLIAYVQTYEKAYGPNTRTQFAAHGFDAYTVLEKAATAALQKPTWYARVPQPRCAMPLRPCRSHRGAACAGGHPANHWGFTNETGVMLQVVGGEFKIALNPLLCMA